MPRPYSSRLLYRAGLVAMVFFGPLFSPRCGAQAAATSAHTQGELQQQFESAQRAQAKGDISHAAEGYRQFLLTALLRLADGQSRAGDFPAAAKLFGEALALDPSDPSASVRVAYADAALLARDIPKAKALAEAILKDHPQSAEAHLVLGEALLQMEAGDEARKQLEAAVALEPGYREGLALATADLAKNDLNGATHLFSEMLTGFGDKASLHLDFGRAFAEAGFPEPAIAEFRKAVGSDPRLPQAHYCLGAAYLQSEGEAAFDKASEEFHRELGIEPEDYFSLSQLGYIALMQHRLPDAERILQHASQLDSHNPDNFLLLGQVYTQMHRPVDAENAFRQSIALSTNLSRNHYQVQRAHYLLGRLLIENGHADEGKQQMQVSADLLRQNMVRDHARLSSANVKTSAATPPLQTSPTSAPVNPAARKVIQEFAQRVAPAMADSYNNLGVIAAQEQSFGSASFDFEMAARWNPATEGLDANWGRAAFSANLFAEATRPLSRYLAAHTEDNAARSMLAISFYRLKTYASVVQTLQPIEASLAGTPQLHYMYARSLVLSGQYDRGLAELQRLSHTHPTLAEVHRALGEAYASHADYQQATAELQTALQLNPSDKEARDQLRLAIGNWTAVRP